MINQFEELIVDDVPYSGLLFGSLGVHTFDDREAHSWALTLGLLGPAAQAETLHKTLHELTDSAEPRGWDNQLKNELVVNVGYERKIKSGPRPIRTSWSRGAWYYDAIAHYGAEVGSVETSVSGGALLRISTSLLDDFGPFAVRPGGQRPVIGNTSAARQVPGFSLYAGIDVRWLGRLIFLDGNTWRNSHSVDREDYAYTFLLGADFRTRGFHVSLSLAIPSKLTVYGNDRDTYGMLTFTQHL